MNIDMQEVLSGGAVPSVVGLVQWVKRFLPETGHKYLPLVAMALGVFYAFSYRPEATIGATVGSGLEIGLAAAGTFASVNSFMKDKKKP